MSIIHNNTITAPQATEAAQENLNISFGNAPKAEEDWVGTIRGDIIRLDRWGGQGARTRIIINLTIKSVIIHRWLLY